MAGLLGFPVQKNKKYYIGFGGYHAAFDRHFAVQGNTGYFTDATHTEKKQVRYRYFHQFKMVLTPVSGFTYYCCVVFLYIMQFLIPAIWVLVFFKIAMGVLLNIARGKPFLPENHHNLFFTAYVILGLPALKLVVSLIAHLFLLPKLTNDVIFDWPDLIFSEWVSWLTGLLVLAFAYAFKKGASLQKELELTV
jgi:Protein of unknown function (DUF2975)